MIVPSLFAGFARVGALGFGGGPSMIPLMQAECVGAGWVSEAQFLEGLALGNALPGPIATKMALFVGWHAGGTLGAIAAILGVLLPSLAMMTVLMAVVVRYKEHPVMIGALKGIKPAVIGMLAFVVWDLGPAGISGVGPALVAVAAFVALVSKVHPASVVLAAMLLGAVVWRA